MKSVTNVLLTEGLGGVVPPQFIEEISTRQGEVLYPPAGDLPREIAKELREQQAAAVVSAAEAMAVDKLDEDPDWPLAACFQPAIEEYVEEARPLEVDARAQADAYPEPSEEEGGGARARGRCAVGAYGPLASCAAWSSTWPGDARGRSCRRGSRPA